MKLAYIDGFQATFFIEFEEREEDKGLWDVERCIAEAVSARTDDVTTAIIFYIRALHILLDTYPFSRRKVIELIDTIETLDPEALSDQLVAALKTTAVAERRPYFDLLDGACPLSLKLSKLPNYYSYYYGCIRKGDISAEECKAILNENNQAEHAIAFMMMLAFFYQDPFDMHVFLNAAAIEIAYFDTESFRPLFDLTKAMMAEVKYRFSGVLASGEDLETALSNYSILAQTKYTSPLGPIVTAEAKYRLDQFTQALDTAASDTAASASEQGAAEIDVASLDDVTSSSAL